MSQQTFIRGGAVVIEDSPIKRRVRRKSTDKLLVPPDEQDTPALHGF